MITAPVSKEKLDVWKQLWQEKAPRMKPNRISGIQLNAYFQEQYAPELYENREFQEVVRWNLAERYGEKAAVSANIICYQVSRNVDAGIDLTTGFFHIESEEIEKCIPIYNDLYVKRGLNAEDLQNFVLTGQYIELLQAKEAREGAAKSESIRQKSF